MYQGHHSDGSSIQRHSAGSHYPYVVGKRAGVVTPSVLCWFVLHPDGREDYFDEGVIAFIHADDLALSRRERQGSRA